jgi:hypothetical protein
MPCLPATRYWRLTLALCAVLSLTSCASTPQVVERVRTVTVEVPVVQPIPASLTRDCPPAHSYGERITVDDIVSRVVALEEALSVCRDQLSRLRK